MTAELRKITCEPPIGNATERLAELQAEIDAGLVSAVAFAVVYRDGCTGQGHSFLHSRATMLGALARLQYRLLKEGDE